MNWYPVLADVIAGPMILLGLSPHPDPRAADPGGDFADQTHPAEKTQKVSGFSAKKA